MHICIYLNAVTKIFKTRSVYATRIQKKKKTFHVALLLNAAIHNSLQVTVMPTMALFIVLNTVM